MQDIFYKAAYLIQEAYSFDDWEWKYRNGNGSNNIAGLGRVEVIEVTKPDTSIVDSYGEYPQGYEGRMTMVFRVDPVDGEPFFVLKEGSKNSYGSERWDGKLFEAQVTTKTVTAYERV